MHGSDHSRAVKSPPLTMAAPSAASDGSYRVVGIVLAVAAIVGLSLRPVLVRVAYGYVVDPVTLLALRMIFALPFFLIVAAWTSRDRRQARLSRRDLVTVGALGFLGYYFASYLDFLGLQYVSAGLGRLLLFLYPTVVVLLSAVFLGKRIVRREIAALAVSYAGIALVLSNAIGSAGASEHLPLGAALVFAGAISFAVYLVGGGHVVHRVGSMRFTAYAMTVASVFCIVQFLMLRPLSALDLPLSVYGLMLAMGTVCTALPVFMMTEALRRIGANHVALIGAIGPVSSIFFGYVGLDERMTLIQLGGAALVLAGVAIVSIKPKDPVT